MSIVAAKGYRASGISCGLKRSGKSDLGLIVSDIEAVAAGVFTRNKVKAAPVLIGMDFLKEPTVKAILANSRYANACTGQRGYDDAMSMINTMSSKLGCKPRHILPASTGVIGEYMPVDKFFLKYDELIGLLSDQSSENGNKFSESILTTDTKIKEATATFKSEGGKTITIGGCTKGSGMIAPNMATTLSFITTDAKISKELLQSTLRDVVDETFNNIVVDGDTSTNDTVYLMANGASGTEEIVKDSEDYEFFYQSLFEVCQRLAIMLVRDGEGASKFLKVNIHEAYSKKEARLAGMSIAKSLLVKTALFGKLDNWGRTVCAAGYSGAEFDPNKAELFISDDSSRVKVFANGEAAIYDKALSAKIFESHDITYDVYLHAGNESTTIYTCDTSLRYVEINGGYKS